MQKNNSIKVSVIMNCHNGANYLSDSIKSLLKQKYKNWELIFWDNMSLDNSKQILLNFKDKRIKYFKSKKFTSLYKARNMAIKKANGKFICFLDTDDWWSPDKLKEQINLVLKNKKANFIYSNFYIFDQNKNKTKIKYTGELPSGLITEFLLKEYKVGILTVMINKKIFKYKKFNEKFNIIGDFDFFINLSLKEKFLCVQKPLAHYRYHNTNFSRKISIYQNELNIWLLENENRFSKLGYSLRHVKLNYLKIKIKKALSYVF